MSLRLKIVSRSTRGASYRCSHVGTFIGTRIDPGSGTCVGTLWVQWRLAMGRSIACAKWIGGPGRCNLINRCSISTRDSGRCNLSGHAGRLQQTNTCGGVVSGKIGRDGVIWGNAQLQTMGTGTTQPWGDTLWDHLWESGSTETWA